MSYTPGSERKHLARHKSTPVLVNNSHWSEMSSFAMDSHKLPNATKNLKRDTSFHVATPDRSAFVGADDSPTSEHEDQFFLNRWNGRAEEYSYQSIFSDDGDSLTGSQFNAVLASAPHVFVRPSFEAVGESASEDSDFDGLPHRSMNSSNDKESSPSTSRPSTKDLPDEINTTLGAHQETSHIPQDIPDPRQSGYSDYYTDDDSDQSSYLSTPTNSSPTRVSHDMSLPSQRPFAIPKKSKKSSQDGKATKIPVPVPRGSAKSATLGSQRPSGAASNGPTVPGTTASASNASPSATPSASSGGGSSSPASSPLPVIEEEAAEHVGNAKRAKIRASSHVSLQPHEINIKQCQSIDERCDKAREKLHTLHGYMGKRTLEKLIDSFKVACQFHNLSRYPRGTDFRHVLSYVREMYIAEDPEIVSMVERHESILKPIYKLFSTTSDLRRESRNLMALIDESQAKMKDRNREIHRAAVKAILNVREPADDLEMRLQDAEEELDELEGLILDHEERMSIFKKKYVDAEAERKNEDTWERGMADKVKESAANQHKKSSPDIPAAAQKRPHPDLPPSQPNFNSEIPSAKEQLKQEYMALQIQFELHKEAATKKDAERDANEVSYRERTTGLEKELQKSTEEAQRLKEQFEEQLKKSTIETQQLKGQLEEQLTKSTMETQQLKGQLEEQLKKSTMETQQLKEQHEGQLGNSAETRRLKGQLEEQLTKSTMETQQLKGQLEEQLKKSTMETQQLKEQHEEQLKKSTMETQQLKEQHEEQLKKSTQQLKEQHEEQLKKSTRQLKEQHEEQLKKSTMETQQLKEQHEGQLGDSAGEIQRLKEQLEEQLGNSAAEILQLKEQLEEQPKNSAAEIQQLKEQYDEQLENSAGQIQRLKEQLEEQPGNSAAEFQHMKEQYDEQLEQATKEIVEWDEKFEKASAEIKQLQERLQEIEHEKSQKESELTATGEELSSTRDSLGEKLRIIEGQNSDLESLRANVSRLTEKLAPKDREIGLLKIQVHQLKSTLSDKDAEILRLSNKMEMAEKENTRRYQELESLYNAAGETARQLESSNQKFQAQARVSLTQEQAHKWKIEAMKTQIDELTRQYAEAVQEKEELKDEKRAAKAKHDREIRGIRVELQTAQTSRGQLEGQIQALAMRVMSCTTSTSVEDLISGIEKRIDANVEELSTATATVNSQSMEKSSLIASLRSELASERESRQQEREIQQTSIDHHMREERRLRKGEAERSAKLLEATRAQAELESRCRQLEAKIKVRESLNEPSFTTSDSLREAEVDQLKREKHQLQMTHDRETADLKMELERERQRRRDSEDRERRQDSDRYDSSRHRDSYRDSYRDSRRDSRRDSYRDYDSEKVRVNINIGSDGYGGKDPALVSLARQKVEMFLANERYRRCAGSMNGAAHDDEYNRLQLYLVDSMGIEHARKILTMLTRQLGQPVTALPAEIDKLVGNKEVLSKSLEFIDDVVRYTNNDPDGPGIRSEPGSVQWASKLTSEMSHLKRALYKSHTGRRLRC